MTPDAQQPKHVRWFGRSEDDPNRLLIIEDEHSRVFLDAEAREELYSVIRTHSSTPAPAGHCDHECYYKREILNQRCDIPRCQYDTRSRPTPAPTDEQLGLPIKYCTAKEPNCRFSGHCLVEPKDGCTIHSTPAPAGEPLTADTILEIGKAMLNDDLIREGFHLAIHEKEGILVSEIQDKIRAEATAAENKRVSPVLEQCEASLKRAVDRTNELCEMAVKLGATPQNQWQFIALLESTVRDINALRRSQHHGTSHLGACPHGREQGQWIVCYFHEVCKYQERGDITHGTVYCGRVEEMNNNGR